MVDSREPGGRFGDAAEAYAESPVHARGRDLDILPDLAPGPPLDFVVDVSCGPGHGAGSLASGARRVVGVDLARGMLEEARHRWAPREGPVLEVVQGEAHDLPLEDGVADVVLNRIAAHHYRDLDAAVAEMARVLAPAGVLLVVDNVAPGDPEVAAFLHDLETRRDPTHVRSRPRDRWMEALGAAGLEAEEVHRFRTRLDVEAWAARAGPAGAGAEALRTLLAEAPQGIRDSLEVWEAPPSFTLPKGIWCATPG